MKIKFFIMVIQFSLSLTATKIYYKQIDNHILFLQNVLTSSNINSIHKNINLLLHHDLPVQDERIINCITEIRLEENIRPLIFLWKNSLKTKIGDNIGFIREISTLILLIYRNIIFNLLPVNLQNNHFEDIILLYQQALNLPINSILEALDNLKDKIINLINSLNLASNNKFSYSQWLKSNWYVPTAISAGIITLTWNYYQDNKKKISN